MAVGRRSWVTLGLLGLSACQNGDPPESPETDATGSTSAAGEDSTGVEPTPTPPRARPDTQSCRFDGWAPGLLPPIAFEPTSASTIEGATALTTGPEGTLLVGTRDGSLWSIDPDDPTEPARELRPADDRPVTGLAAGTSDGQDTVFVRLHNANPSGIRVVRYTFESPRIIDLASVIDTLRVDLDAEGRHGEGLWLTDGLLWIPVGDGDDGESFGPSGDPTQPEGNLLRIDVSTLSHAFGYDRPDDNPLPDQPGVAPLAWAWGLRDPSGCTTDRSADPNRVWCVDRGAITSEVDLVPAAADLGWPHVDGPVCQLFGGCDSLDVLPPEASYRHIDEDCGVGAFAVMRGTDPDLEGAIVYGDRCSGRLYAARPSHASAPSARALVGRSDPLLVAMTSDPAGGVWAIDVHGQLGRMVVQRPPGEFPTALSQSRCFEGAEATAPAPDLVPYTLNAPLWTDSSHKERHLVLPPDAHLSVESDGELRFPEGTIILKTFSYPAGPLEPDRLVPAETRVMIRRSFAWEFHSYAWNEDGTEAALLEEGSERTLLTAVDGAPTIVRHTFPSRDECGYCHGSGDARALGPRLDQLDRELDYGDQLQSLATIGLFDGPAPRPTAPMADYRDPSASDEDRARAYLHANCGHCHRPGGWTPPDLDMDLRWSTPLAETRLCDVEPQYSSTFDADRRIAPGDASDSLVWLRLLSRGPWQMPPFATSIPDPSGNVVRRWIEGLDDCAEP